MMHFIYPSARLIRVVDGDTVKLRVDCGFGVFVEQTFRLAEVNCPELSTAEGKGARLFAESWFTKHAGECQVESHGRDKYGRWLGTIASVNDIHETLNGALLANSYAVPYEG